MSASSSVMVYRAVGWTIRNALSVPQSARNSRELLLLLGVQLAHHVADQINARAEAVQPVGDARLVGVLACRDLERHEQHPLAISCQAGAQTAARTTSCPPWPGPGSRSGCPAGSRRTRLVVEPGDASHHALLDLAVDPALDVVVLAVPVDDDAAASCTDVISRWNSRSISCPLVLAESTASAMSLAAISREDPRSFRHSLTSSSGVAVSGSLYASRGTSGGTGPATASWSAAPSGRAGSVQARKSSPLPKKAAALLSCSSSSHSRVKPASRNGRSVLSRSAHATSSVPRSIRPPC